MDCQGILKDETGAADLTVELLLIVVDLAVDCGDFAGGKTSAADFAVECFLNLMDSHVTLEEFSRGEDLATRTHFARILTSCNQPTIAVVLIEMSIEHMGCLVFLRAHVAIQIRQQRFLPNWLILRLFFRCSPLPSSLLRRFPLPHLVPPSSIR